LILGGAFDILHSNRASLLASLDQAMEQGELFREFKDQPQLFQDKIELDATYTVIDDISKMKRLRDEKELFGFYISSHPLADYRNRLEEQGYLSMKQAFKKTGKRNIRSVVVVQAIKTIRTKRGDTMAFITISDETGEMEAVIFPDLYREVNRFLEEEMLIYIKGKLESRNNTIQWLLSVIEPFTEQLIQKKESAQKQRLFIRYPKDEHYDNMLFIQSIADMYPGKVPIIVYHEEVRETYQLKQSYHVSAEEKCLAALRDRFGKSNVVFGE